MLILSFESSCDETSAAVCEFDENKKQIRSNIIASQIETHKLYGGVVPEIASRAHCDAITNITYEALDTAGVTLADIDAIAVTNTPGLIGALLVGVSFAKSLAIANNIPLVPVNHIKGHTAANYFVHPDLKPPFLALVASGGHTSLIRVDDYTTYTTIGRTRDDAIGEAFDKVGRVMGLPYPGGAEMDRLASIGNPNAIKFPSAAVVGDNLDFSFSGLKTAVINHLHNCDQKGESYVKEDIAASFTKTVISSVTKKLEMAYEATGLDKIVIAGGVSANSHLRAALEEFCNKRQIHFYMPPLSLCGDNAAMIAAQGYYEYLAGVRGDSALNAKASGQ
ncbi:MAG: tRNA (adenosine(37)-N6)-threonylcarbamoyltransferase complex transferase subunit TsaD [Clostridiales bacterium]|nr:tRNA (adenosine(37)-N6)-threonylcarbamoyltransferase complex transferase subunit TsaD [Clostridiales bacterium]